MVRWSKFLLNMPGGNMILGGWKIYPFWIGFGSFIIFFATMLHAKTMPSLEFINSYELTACPAGLLYS